jgi:putative lipoprotein
MNTIRTTTALLTVIFILVACAAPGATLPGNATVTGSVTYAPGLTLPADATVTVELIDLTLQPAPGDSTTIDPAAAVGEQQIATNGNQAPFAFEISYQPDAIDQTHQYGVSARITDAKGKVLFASTAYVPAVTDGAGTNNLLVEVVPIAESPTAAGAGAATDLAGTVWEAFLLNDGKGALVNVMDVAVTASFAADGTVSGSGGCNEYTAPYTVTAGVIQFGPLTATKKTCSEPAGVMAQETQYFAALASAVSYQLQADELLEMENADGESAVQFKLIRE